MSKITDFHFKPLNEYKYNLIEKKMDIKYSKFSVREKVKVNGLNAIIEAFGVYNNQFYYKLEGLPFDFNENELSKIDNDMIHVEIDFTKGGYTPNSELTDFDKNKKLDSIIEKYDKIKREQNINFYKIGDFVKVKGYENDLFEIIDKDKINGLFNLKSLYTNNRFLDVDVNIIYHAIEFTRALKKVIDKSKNPKTHLDINIGDYVEISEKWGRSKKPHKVIDIKKYGSDYYYYLDGNDYGFSKHSLRKVAQNEIPTKEPKLKYEFINYEPEVYSFIATWQKQREFYLIETKGGSLSRMDKPEFEEYCEKMDKLGIKYKIIN